MLRFLNSPQNRNEIFWRGVTASAVHHIVGKNDIAYHVASTWVETINRRLEWVPICTFQLKRNARPVAAPILGSEEAAYVLLSDIKGQSCFSTSPLSAFKDDTQYVSIFFSKSKHGGSFPHSSMISQAIGSIAFPSALNVSPSPHKSVKPHANHAVSMSQSAHRPSSVSVIMAALTDHAEKMLSFIQGNFKCAFGNEAGGNVFVNNFRCFQNPFSITVSHKPILSRRCNTIHLSFLGVHDGVA